MTRPPDPTQVRRRLDAVVAAMGEAGLWDVPRPDDDAFADMGPFGQRTMAFAQWLRFVFVPNVEALVSAGGPFPDGSSVAAIAAREGDTDPAVASLVPALAAFDALFGDGPPPADGGEDDGRTRGGDARGGGADDDGGTRGRDARGGGADDDGGTRGGGGADDGGGTPGGDEEAGAAARARASYDRSRRCLDAGDRAGALAAIEEAVAADPTLRDVHNVHGWALVSGPAASLAHLEAGVAAFRESRRRHPDLPEALVNLCDALLRLGRGEEAVAEAQGATGDPEPTGAVAHNWLGWYRSTHAPDLRRAEADLREAIRRRPRFGTAWQNLGRLLERQGELGPAYHAYGEAVACGDAYDEPTARQRHLALHLALTQRGEAPPEGSQPPPAADLTGLALLDALAHGHQAVVGPRQLGLRPSQRTPEGGVPFSVLFLQTEARFHVLALVSDLRDFRVVTTQARAQDVIVLRDTQVHGEDLSGAARAVAAWLEDPAGLAPEAVTPLDAGLHVLGAMSESLPRPHGWRLAGMVDASRPDRPAFVSVVARGAPMDFCFTVEALPGDAVTLRLLPPGLGAPAPVERVASLAELGGLTSRLVSSTRAALAAWDAYRDRDLGAPKVGQVLAARLRDLGDRRWRAEITDDGYPHRAGEAWIVHQGRVDRYLVRVTEDAEGCTAEVDGEQHRIGALADIDAAVPAIATAAAAVLARFSVGDLGVGDHVRVLEAFAGFAVGERLTVADHRYDPHGGDTWCLEGPGGRKRWLDVMMDADLEILGHLDRYLAPAY